MKKRNLLLWLIVLTLALSACSSRDDKNPYGSEDKYEEGKFNDSGYESGVISELDLTQTTDAFVKKFVSNLIQNDYEVFDVEGIDLSPELSKYGEEAVYNIFIKDLPEINVYKFNKDSEDLVKISNTNLLDPISNLGPKQNAIVFDRYVLAIDSTTEEVMEIFNNTGRIVK